jgi:acyl-CoA synthetase (AMP-forming)/AMP-acid ligase II
MLEPLPLAPLEELVEDRAHADDPWLILPEDPLRSERARTLSYSEVCRAALSLAPILVELTGGRSRPVVLALDNGEACVTLFLAAIAAHIPPIVRSPPWWKRDGFHELQQVVLASGAEVVVVPDDFLPAAEATCGEVCRVIGLSRLGETASMSSTRVPAKSDVAFIQYSSGTTREPLGIAIAEQAARCNVAGIGQALELSDKDVIVSWLPLGHDMGLVGSFLCSFYWRTRLVLMSPLSFMMKPARWLWAIARFNGTVSAGPNWAYSALTSPARTPEASIEGLDLRSWRAAINGAEFVQRETLEAFERRFARYGLSRRTMAPAYGLAENAVACTIASGTTGRRVDTVDRRALESGGRAIPRVADDGSTSVVSVGPPIAGCSVRITDTKGRPMEERVIGEIMVRGGSTMVGYWRRPKETALAVTRSGWLRTGDLGYLAEGELYVVGRKTQVIKRGGKRYDGAAIARAVAEVEGVRKDSVCVIATPDPSAGLERAIVLAEVVGAGELDAGPLVEAIRTTINHRAGLCVDDVLLLPKGRLPKSSSGKIRLEEVQRLYRAGKLGQLHEDVQRSS